MPLGAGGLSSKVAADPDSASAAEDAALRILAAAAQSADGLRRRLQRRGFSDEAAAAATSAMVALGYVDDAALAGAIAARQQRTGHGRIRVAAELRVRGVDDEAITRTLQEVDIDAERAAALELGRRLSQRFTPDMTAHDRRRRAGASLQRRGFDAETIHWVLRQLERPD